MSHVSYHDTLILTLFSVSKMETSRTEPREEEFQKRMMKSRTIVERDLKTT